MIGIFIGIAAVVSLIGLGEGLRNAITGQFGFLGTDVLSIQASGLAIAGPPGTGTANPLSDDLAEKICDRLFGCEECVLTCPYQKNAPVCKNKQFKFYSDRAEIDLQEILKLTEEQFQTRFADSAILRSGLEILKRNAQICLKNSSHNL